MSLVLLDTLLPIEAVRLGRLVLDIRCPHQDYFEPEEAPLPEEILTQRLSDFSYSSKQGKSSSMNVILSTLVSGTRGTENSSRIDLSSSACVTHQLQNSTQFFQKICALRGTRAWLERAIRRRKGVFLITGIKTVADAHLDTAETESRSLGGDLQAPASLAATAMGLPLPGGTLEVGAGGKRSADGLRKTGFVVPGEQVFAVQYRKARVSWLSSRSVENARLEAGNQWKVYVGGRGEEDEDEKTVQVELDDSIQDEDRPTAFNVIDIDGERYLHLLNAS
ncbi:hypothetical protein ACQKWADRAFT_306196 [Trichoderma austrokoningii]